ncbi:metacaspase-1-like [Impatiens glandulifera]|uniref:metacaspase-1-like n=1 Tax=Impatiens glandulifera TaxID=253017 RepID=UPI001FB15B19|nr:metacaspase-1-like [Impatiens glandulifera]
MESRKCNLCHNQLEMPPTAPCKCLALYSVGSLQRNRNYNTLTVQKEIQPSNSFSTRLWRRMSSSTGNSSYNARTGESEKEKEKESFPWIGNGVNPLNSTTSGPHQSRKALLCGVSYKKDKYELKGTVNDVKNMWNLLIELKFPKDAICVLTEENDPSLFPTKENMKRALKWLVKNCKAGDSLIFYFSGHGVRQLDFDDDEVDGYNETLCPVDFKTSGMIFDNEINDAIVKPIKTDVKLHAIIDACHSGTVIDLEYVYNRAKKCWIGNKPPCGANKSTDGGIAISLSACADDRLAADTTAFSRDMMTGALTYVFTNIMRQKRGKVTYAELLNEMNEKIVSVNTSRSCLSTPLIKRLLRNKIIQEPQLSASKVIDMNGYLTL